jgi:peptidoglycan hydrolase-like protein with peptidoglycan-binding domain
MTALQELQPEAFEFHNEFEYGGTGGGNRNNNEFVKWVQRSLNQILGLRLTEDGIAGPQTRSAIRSFQQKQGITPDGVVGQKTEKALIDASATTPTITLQPDRIIVSASAAPAQLISTSNTAIALDDPRVDVTAKFALQRMMKRFGQQQDAARLIAGINSGQLAGIFGDDLAVTARLAKKWNTAGYLLVPKGADSVVVLDPENPKTAPPTIVFRGNKQVRYSTDRLHSALQQASRTLQKLSPKVIAACSSGGQSRSSNSDSSLLAGSPIFACINIDEPPPIILVGSKFVSTVSDFKQAISDERLVTNGQFFWKSLMEAALENDPPILPKAIVSGKEIYDRLWRQYLKDQTPFDKDSLREFFKKNNLPLTVKSVAEVLEHERDKCEITAGHVSRLASNKMFSVDRCASSCEKTIRKVRVGLNQPGLDFDSLITRVEHPKLTPESGSNERQDILVYKKSPPFSIGLTDVLEVVRRALKGGFFVIAGVLSGVKNNQPSSRKPEHFLLILDVDDEDRFLFWDPDASVSKWTIFGQGFGVLFFDKTANRFTTAKNDADIEVFVFGVHIQDLTQESFSRESTPDNPQIRKRYQVMTLRCGLQPFSSPC